MAVPLEEFIQQLEDSGILTGGTITDFIPPKASPKNATELARELIRNKKLTKFQAEEVSKGNGKSLVLGNYVLLEKIGAGGMGEVYKAEHRRMHRIVAVKVLPASTMKDPVAIARFEREVTAAAKISHPNIVAAFDADQANGVHFLVMELVDGNDLSALVKKNGPFPVDKAVDFVLQAARGLEAAHAVGIVHRDIKPANLLLDKKGTVKILDMGLARIESPLGDAATQAELTGTGAVMGTVDYMSPEQAFNTKHADARADIYSLGCTLYYLVAGKATYSGETVIEKILAHREKPIPSLRGVQADISSQLETVFQKMIAKKIEGRYTNMTQLLVDLEKCHQGNGTTLVFPERVCPADDFGQPTLLDSGSVGGTQPVVRTTRTPGQSGNKPFLPIGAAFLGVLILLAALVVKLKTKDGTLVVTVNEPDAQVEVLNEEGKVEISQKGGNETISISVDPGKHRLKVTKDGFTVFGQDIEIAAGGKQPITAKLMPLNEKPLVVGTKPDLVAGMKKSLFFQTPGFDPWAKGVAALPVDKQADAVSKKLVELNPEFDGKVAPTIENGVVTNFHFLTDNVTDISPVRALGGLKTLDCRGGGHVSGKLSDLSPLHGMPLTTLGILNTQVSDLSPLKDMPLEWLHCGNTPVSSLSPLEGATLTSLDCSGTKVSDLSPLRGFKLINLNCAITNVSDLSPLQGMPLKTLVCAATKVANLFPLQGMHLENLHVHETRVFDLSLLQGMNLTDILITPKNITRGLDVIRQMQSFKAIGIDSNNFWAPDEFWKKFDAGEFGKPISAKPITDINSPAFQQWMKDVQAMPAEKQVESVSKKLMELNPGFDGKLAGWEVKGMPQIENGAVTTLGFSPQDVTDLSPLQALTQLKDLYCAGEGKLSDLTPLQGMPLRRLQFDYSKVFDLSPLRGMKLKALSCGDTLVSDLSPLKGMPLDALNCPGTQVSDLSPLEGMQLTFLGLNGTKVSDLSRLKGMPLKAFSLNVTKVSDLSPLRDMPLQSIYLDFNPERDTELLRSIKTLETINGKPAVEFWKDIEEQQKGKKP